MIFLKIERQNRSISHVFFEKLAKSFENTSFDQKNRVVSMEIGRINKRNNMRLR
jgi:hypothetical protein